MTFLIFKGSWHVTRHCIWSSNVNQSIYWIDNKLHCLIYLILFYLGLWFIFGLTY